MGTVRCVLSVQFVILLLPAPMTLAEMHSASFAIPTAVLGGGAGTMSSASFAMQTDADGDGRIGIIEAILPLRKLGGISQ